MARLKRTQFWGEDENDDHLILQIIKGEKTATCCPSEFYNTPDGEFHDGGFIIGDLIEVYDLKEKLRCLVKVDDIYETTLGNAPEKLWQGECCISAVEFLLEHFNCWKSLDVSEQTLITATHFELTEVFNTT